MMVKRLGCRVKPFVLDLPLGVRRQRSIPVPHGLLQRPQRTKQVGADVVVLRRHGVT